MRWTKAFRKAAGKEMTVDSTFEFEKRRNVPVRYDRELMDTTIKAIKRVQEIKSKRERIHQLNRTKGKLAKEMDEAVKQIKTGESLLHSMPLVKKKQTVKVATVPIGNRMDLD